MVAVDSRWSNGESKRSTYSEWLVCRPEKGKPLDCEVVAFPVSPGEALQLALPASTPAVASDRRAELCPAYAAAFGSEGSTERVLARRKCDEAFASGSGLADCVLKAKGERDFRGCAALY